MIIDAYQTEMDERERESGMSKNSFGLAENICDHRMKYNLMIFRLANGKEFMVMSCWAVAHISISRVCDFVCVGPFIFTLFVVEIEK